MILRSRHCIKDCTNYKYLGMKVTQNGNLAVVIRERNNKRRESSVNTRMITTTNMVRTEQLRNMLEEARKDIKQEIIVVLLRAKSWLSKQLMLGHHWEGWSEGIAKECSFQMINSKLIALFRIKSFVVKNYWHYCWLNSRSFR